MTRPVMIFDFIDWYRVPNGGGSSWDCDFLALVLLPDGKVETRVFNSQSEIEKVEEEFPEAIHMGELNRSKDRFEINKTTRCLKADHPEAYAALSRWTPFKEEEEI